MDYPVTEVLYNVLVKPRLIQAEGETEQEYEVRKAGLAAKSKSGKSSAKRRMPESDEDFQNRLAAWFAGEPRFTRQELLLDFDSIDNVRQMVWDISKELLDTRRTGRWHQNSGSCFGFGRCMYWPICSAMGNDETVDVYIMGEAGPPDPPLIDAVQTVVDDNRPITADALVFSPEVVTIPITLTVTPRAGYDTAAMDTEIRRRLSVFFGDIEDATLPITPLGVGKDVVVAQIMGVVMAVPGVYSVLVEEPAADIIIDPNQFPEQGLVSINMEAPSDE